MGCFCGEHRYEELQGGMNRDLVDKELSLIIKVEEIISFDSPSRTSAFVSSHSPMWEAHYRQMIAPDTLMGNVAESHTLVESRVLCQQRTRLENASSADPRSRAMPDTRLLPRGVMQRYDSLRSTPNCQSLKACKPPTRCRYALSPNPFYGRWSTSRRPCRSPGGRSGWNAKRSS